MDIEYTESDVYSQTCKIAEIAVLVASGDLKKRELICDFFIEDVDVTRDITDPKIIERFRASGLYDKL